MHSPKSGSSYSERRSKLPSVWRSISWLRWVRLIFAEVVHDPILFAIFIVFRIRQSRCERWRKNIEAPLVKDWLNNSLHACASPDSYSG